MSKRADLKEWTVCPDCGVSIKKENLPWHLKNLKRSEHKKLLREKREKSWFARMIDRLMGHDSKGEAEQLRAIADNLEHQGD